MEKEGEKMSLARVLKSIIEMRQVSVSDPKSEMAPCLIKKYQALRKFFLAKSRAELAIIFVAFCEGKISVDLFRAKVSGLRRQQRTAKKPIAPKPR
ncbi:MAG: hypothetical protein ABIG65_00855 [Patescibacteria group bacterium]